MRKTGKGERGKGEAGKLQMNKNLEIDSIQFVNRSSNNSFLLMKITFNKIISVQYDNILR